MMRTLVWTCVFVISLMGAPWGQETQAPAAPSATAAVQAPALTKENKLELENLRQRLEIAQLKAQAAQVEFDTAKVQLQQLLGTLTKPGYRLDLEKMEYVKLPDAPKK